VYNIKIHHI